MYLHDLMVRAVSIKAPSDNFRGRWCWSFLGCSECKVAANAFEADRCLSEFDQQKLARLEARLEVQYGDSRFRCSGIDDWASALVLVHSILLASPSVCNSALTVSPTPHFEGQSFALPTSPPSR